jgi:hypothetical protein
MGKKTVEKKGMRAKRVEKKRGEWNRREEEWK